MNNTNATNNSIGNVQVAAIEQYMANLQTKEVWVHELFGFDTPVKGFDKEPIAIPTEAHPLSPEIDKGYVFSKSQVRRFLLSMEARESIMLVGDKGTGKSSFIQQVMARMNLPLLAINGGPSLDEVDLLGCKTIKDVNVAYVDGILSYAFRKGVPVLIDELCTLKPGVLVAINDILQGDRVVTLKHHGIDPTLDPRELQNIEGSMSIVRHPFFRLFATDNTGGKAARDARFSGVHTQNSAVRSRFTSFKVVFMRPEDEVKALWNAVNEGYSEEEQVDRKLLELMVEFAFRFRAAFEQGESFDNISFRELKRWAKKYASYGDLDEAFVDALYTNLEDTDQQLAEELFTETFGRDLRLTEEFQISASSMLDEFVQQKAA